MELKIYSQSGAVKAVVSPEDSSTNSKEIMGDNVLTLSFKHYLCVSIDVNDYADFMGERFFAMEQYTPTQKSSVEWEYTIQFYGLECLIKRILVLQLADNENEPVFSLTAPAIEHVRLFVDNINRAMFTSDWKVGEVIATPNLTVDYSGTFINKGLDEVADLASTEWWIEGQTVNLSRCEHGSPLTLGYRKGLLSLTRDTNENAKFFTRLFPTGSRRNIDRETYGYSRLQLPDRQKYLEQNTQYGVIEHFEESAFADIYPRRTGTVGTVRDEEKKGENGKPFSIYYFTDPSLNFDPNDYLLPGLVATVVFQSGELNGRDFEVNYHSSGHEFEIITQFPYDDETQLPGGSLVPKAGDEYILYNIRMPDEYIQRAELELEQAVLDYMEKNRLDKSAYKGPTDYIDLAGREVTLTLGQAVRLESDEFFPVTGYRLSRISRIVRKVNHPLQADIEIADLADRGKMSSLEGGIDQANRYVQAALGGLPGIIKSWETTPATDTNLFSARKTEREFLSKIRADVAQKRITFREGIKGNILESEHPFLSGQFGTGFKAWMKNGQSYFEMDNLFVRRETIFSKLTIAEIKAVGGQILVSLASLYCTKMQDRDEDEDGKPTGSEWPFYRCYFDDGGENPVNMFGVGDQAICRRFTGRAVKYYWRLVSGVGADYIDLSKSDADGSGVPEEGDEIVQFGNRGDTSRQSAILISAYGTDSPSIRQYAGIDSYDLTGKEVTSISPSGNRFTGLTTMGDNNSYARFDPITKRMTIKGTLVQSSAGDTQPLGFFRGEYNSSYTYYEGDQVTYQGSYYRYIYATPSSTLPTNTAYWTVLAAKGEPGTNGVASDWKTLAYQKSATNPGSPYDTSPIPYGWQDYPDSQAEGDDKWWMIVAFVHWTGTEWLAGSYYDGYFYAGSWSEPIPVTGEDAEVQFIDFKFCVTSDLNPPYWSDYLASLLNPDGWDDQPPQMPTGGAIWMIQAWKLAGGMTLAGTWSAPVRISGEDGSPGKDGSEIEYIYSRTIGPHVEEGIVPAPNNDDDYVPPGWTDDPQGVSETYKYEWISTRKKVNGIWGGFSTAALWAKWGMDGKEGAFYEYRFRASTSTTSPGVPPIGDNPSGWSTITPILTDLSYLWMTQAKKNADGTLYLGETWSTPVRITGERGTNGKIGPAPVYCGKYEEGKIYYGTEDRVDIVEYNGFHYVARVDAGEFSDVPPDNTGSWNPFGSEFVSVATDLLLTPRANIAGWIFRNERMESQSGNAFLDGNNGLLSLAGGKILLKEDGSGRLANGGIEWDTEGNITIQSNRNGYRIEIDPHSVDKLRFITPEGSDVGAIGFYNGGGASAGNLSLTNLTSSGQYDASVRVSPRNFHLMSVEQSQFSVTLRIDGKLIISMINLPTSASGLASGSLWRDGTLLRIVP
jgi:hypothetical protein